MNVWIFADDSTFYISHNDIDELIKIFKLPIKPLLTWCSFNKLDLWSKTFFIFKLIFKDFGIHLKKSINVKL